MPGIWRLNDGARGRRRRWLALATAMIVAASCSGSTAGSSDETEVVDYLLQARLSTSTDSRGAEVEEEIARCMRERGFEYSPATSPRSAGVEGGAAGFWLAPDRELAEAEGFGIVGALVEAGDERQTPTQGGPTGAGGAEGLAFQQALYGTEAEQRENGGGAAGCSAEADGIVAARRSDPELLDAATALADLMASSGVLLEIEEDWSLCMADQGFRVASESDAQQLVFDKISSAGADRAGRSEALAGRALEDLLSFERSVAVADVECIQPLHDTLHSELHQLARQALG